jgi:hypothetical protein
VKLYRMMKAAADGLPEVGTKFGMLGVRPKDPTNPKKRFDVPATAPTDPVSPGDGMSVNADPAALKPPDDEFLLWVIEAADLGSDLAVSPARPPHYHVGPSHDMTLAELQQRLAATRDRWQRV